MILVTGATGHSGQELIGALRAKNAKFAVLVRGPKAAEELQGEGIEIRIANLAEPETVSRALAGVETAFLVSPAMPDMPLRQGQFVQAAKHAKVKRVVKMSVIGAHPYHSCGFLRWNGVAESILMNSGLSWTVLRTTSLLQEIGMLSAGTVKERSGIYLPAGNSRVPMIDTRDIAAAAATVLTEGDHDNRIYDLTGPELIAQHDIAAALTASLGREIGYHPISDADAWKAMRKNDLPEIMCHAFITLWQSYRRGESDFVSGWAEILTGRKPAGLEDYLRENIALFRT